VFPVLRIGPAAIQTPLLLLFLGIFLGIMLSEHFARKRGENPDTLTNLIIVVGVAGLVTARLTYAAEHMALFQKNLAGLISPDPTLLDIWGGLAGAGIAALIVGQRKQLRFWESLDRLTPFLAVLAVFMGLSHFASGRAFGAPTSLPWAIYLWGVKRHPSQIYETVGAIFILLLFWRQYKAEAMPGTLFLKFAASTSGLAVFLAAFRGDSRLVLGTFRQEQLLALIILGLAFLFLEIKSRPQKAAQGMDGNTPD
jgi:phosphatidylglycerol:prolipoprotein diacylglycerol transferase